MNRIHIIGDSYAVCHRFYINYPKILAENLDCELISHAASGTGGEYMIYRFFDLFPDPSDIGKDDLFILTFTSLNRPWMFAEDPNNVTEIVLTNKKVKRMVPQQDKIDWYASMANLDWRAELHHQTYLNFLWALEYYAQHLIHPIIILPCFELEDERLQKITKSNTFPNIIVANGALETLSQQELKYETIQDYRHQLTFVGDARMNHLFAPNHLILAQKIYDAIFEKRSLVLNKEDFLSDLEALENIGNPDLCRTGMPNEYNKNFMQSRWEHMDITLNMRKK